MVGLHVPHADQTNLQDFKQWRLVRGIMAGQSSIVSHSFKAICRTSDHTLNILKDEGKSGDSWRLDTPDTFILVTNAKKRQGSITLLYHTKVKILKAFSVLLVIAFGRTGLIF